MGGVADGAAVEKKVDDWWVGAYRLMKTFGDDYPEAKSAAGELREQTDAFKKIVPIISTLATPALRERHWTNISYELEEEIEIEAMSDMSGSDGGF